MAEDNSSEKQHLPSAKRLEHMRREGQTLRSRDLTSGLVFLVAIGSLMFMATQIKTRMELNFTWFFTHIKQVIDAPQFNGDFLADIILQNFKLLLPTFLLLLIAALLSPFIFGGWNFSMKSVEFNFNKLSPMRYFSNIFSVKIFYEIFKSLFKLSLLMTVLIYFIFSEKAAIISLTNMPVKEGISLAFTLTERFIIYISVTLIFIVLVDVMYHYFEFQGRSKMSTQELKDEHKESEGSPEMKRKMRSAQFAILKQRLSTTVPKASVVITNPTHYAVALRYDESQDGAPKIIAKGKGHIAQQIRQLAIANGVAIYQAPPLARAIYNSSNVGSSLHPGLYMAVAIILSYVHQLKNYQQGIGGMPRFVNELQIPEELIFDE